MQANTPAAARWRCTATCMRRPLDPRQPGNALLSSSSLQIGLEPRASHGLTRSADGLLGPARSAAALVRAQRGLLGPARSAAAWVRAQRGLLGPARGAA